MRIAIAIAVAAVALLVVVLGNDINRARLGAYLGRPDAQLTLGYYYGTGRGGVVRNEAEAVKWYRRAAEQGNPQAQFVLAERHRVGHGLPKDLVQAYMWTSLSAERGFPQARDSLVGLEMRMSPAQIAEAHRSATEWNRAHGS